MSTDVEFWQARALRAEALLEQLSRPGTDAAIARYHIENCTSRAGVRGGAELASIRSALVGHHKTIKRLCDQLKRAGLTPEPMPSRQVAETDS